MAAAHAAEDEVEMLRRTICTLGVCTSAALAVSGSRSLAQEPPISPSPSAQVQQQGPSFRGGVDLIQLVVSVLDDKRQPVRGLTAADFTILDEGIERPVRAFTPVDVPAAEAPVGVAAWTRDVAPDVASNQITEQPGRLVVIVMDRSIHQGPTAAAWQVARSIVDELGPNDLAALVATNEFGRPQNFTGNRARLLGSIDRRTWAIGSGASPWTQEGALRSIRCPCGLCVLEAVTRIAEAVRDTPGRTKSLFFIGSGMVLQTNTAPCDHQLRVARQTMLDAIDLSNLTVHSIDPKGLESIGPQTRASSPGGKPMPEGAAAAERRAAQLSETTETLAAQGTLHVLPDMTGGRTIVNRNLPEEMVPTIFRESASYYVLGFEAEPDNQTGLPRSIAVQVARTGVTVSTRRRYLPPTPDAPDSPASSRAAASPSSPEESVSGLLPDGVPRLTMALAAFASEDGSDGIVSVSVDAGGFVNDAVSSIPLEVLVTAVDQTGRAVASARQTSTIPGPRPTSTGVSTIHIPTHLALPPGDYEVRAAITDTDRGTTASVFSHIVVPAFASDRLSLSDIAVERVAAASGAATTPFPAVVPTTERSFTRSARVRARLQIYQGTERRNAVLPVSVETRVIDTQDRVVSETGMTLPRDAFRDRRADFIAMVPLQPLPSGEYLLSVVATAGNETATRVVRFRVQ
jgi:VWFA-related protein